jgi:tetratricopeptide (TPR) repeat protein
LKVNEKALQVYNDILELNPLSAMAYVGRGTALEHLGRNKQAEAAYQSAAQLSYRLSGDRRERVWPHYVLGRLYLRQKRLEEAKTAAEEAIAQDTQEHWIEYPLWLLGRIALEREEYEDAVKHFSRMLDYTSRSYLQSQAFLGLAHAHINREDIEHGLIYLKKAHIEDPQNKGLHRYFAEMLLESGHYEEAVQAYERYLEKWGPDQEAEQALKEARDGLGER